jgi:hypothetical protein
LKWASVEMFKAAIEEKEIAKILVPPPKDIGSFV